MVHSLLLFRDHCYRYFIETSCSTNTVTLLHFCYFYLHDFRVQIPKWKVALAKLLYPKLQNGKFWATKNCFSAQYCTYNRRKNVNSLSYFQVEMLHFIGVSLKNQSIHVNLNYHLPAKRPKSPPPLPSPPWQRQTRKSSKQPQCFHPNFLCSIIIPSLAPQPNLHFLKGQLFWQNHGSGSSVWPTFYIKNRKEKNTKRC